MSTRLKQAISIFTVFLATLFIIRYVLPTFAGNPPITRTPKLGFFNPPTVTPTPTSTPSPTPTAVNFNNPPKNDQGEEGSNDTGQQAPDTDNPVTQLVQSIRNYCRLAGPDGQGQVSSRNLSCLDRIVPALSSAILDRLKLSARTYNYLQCVGLVRAVLVIATGSDFDTSGNAIDYATRIPRGYRLIRKTSGTIIKTGDVPVWDYDTYGHIAYVVKVYNANTFRIAEANFGTPGKVQERNTTRDVTELVGWLSKI